MAHAENPKFPAAAKAFLCIYALNTAPGVHRLADTFPLNARVHRKTAAMHYPAAVSRYCAKRSSLPHPVQYIPIAPKGNVSKHQLFSKAYAVSQPEIRILFRNLHKSTVIHHFHQRFFHLVFQIFISQFKANPILLAGQSLL